MEGDDFDWAADVMERRRTVYEGFSPVFWKPASGVRDMHAGFLRAQVDGGGAVGLRTRSGFVLAAIRGDRYEVDDFAVEPDHRWSTDGPRLLRSVVEHGPLGRPAHIRVVTARQDVAKRTMLQDLGLEVASRWWVKPLRPAAPAEVRFAEVRVAGSPAVLVPAPPVYAPGGPVCMLSDVDAGLAGRAARDAEEVGAVLAIVTRDAAPASDEPELTAAGFDNAAVFFAGSVGPTG